MQKGKTWQRVASAVLAVMMTMSTFSSTIAYAAEPITADSSLVTDAVSESTSTETVEALDSASSSSSEEEITEPVGTPVPTEMPDETDSSEPEATPEPTEVPTSTPEPTETPDATATPEPTEVPEATETPDVDESDFVAVSLADDATEGQVEAEIGDEVTFNAHVNRNDVNLHYQWYKRFIEPQDTDYDMDVIEYDYNDAEPTTYGYLNDDKTPAETLADNPDATWSGIELYRAVADAMAAIGADASNINIEFNTRNYALEGFEITAANVDGNIVISADKGNEHASATLNENNEFVFTESTTNDVAVQSAETEQSEENQDTLTANGWEAIEGATSDTYTHTIDEYDAYTTYRCVITIDDDNYIAAAKKELIANGADESKLTDDTLDNTITTEVTVSIPSMEKSEDEMYNDLSVEDKLKQRLANSGIATYAAGVQLDSQTNPQWVTGLSAGMEYLTADMYAKIYGQDGKGGWLATGEITGQQADRMWTYVANNRGVSPNANVLDADGKPTGATRKYQSFALTDGNKLEINSEWYGKTVYFRYHNSNIVGNTATGAAVSIPASGRGTSYKDAVQVLFCYTVEENGVTLPLTIKSYVQQATSNGYAQNGMAHITLNTVSCNDFNIDPDRYLKDAEGNYRVDSVYYGTCYYSEPDLSGKGYYALKNYIGNGYGFGIGHDTMYAYAGAWFDAYGGGAGYPNNVYDERKIDPNDTATRYYNVNSWTVSGGHWNMNALMGENNSNTLVGSGYYSASDEEYFGWIVDPLTVPSAIMSSGGSHGPFLKTTIYGGRSLRIRSNGGFTYEEAMVNPDIKHRTPTNWPYKFSVGQTIPSALTHSNGQVAFDDIWVQYNGCASDFTNAGLGKLYEPTVDGRSGTNNFYLAGSGNFVMNQIGHLPIETIGGHKLNAATTEEMQLCVNTLMWISQRKQCEVCAADQADQQMTHFVHRVNAANAKKILTALANGGSYWYPLSDCYELMEDLDLTKLGFDSTTWKPIKNFTGHWNSKYFDVKVPKDGALFDNTTGDLGAYRTGDGNDWNLGTDRLKGWDTVFKDSGNSSPSVRTTGIARIYGKLSDAKLFNDGQIHEGYTVHIRYEDNTALLQEGDDFSCVVNNVDQYCISNLPCIYVGGKTILRARVYDKAGNEVTKYGPIVAKVPPHFWNDCETVPLELLTIEATPIENYRYWEGETTKVLEGSGIIYNQPISNESVTWYYRVVDLRNTNNALSDWVKIGHYGQFTTEDGAVTGIIKTPVFHDGNDGVYNYPHSSVDVQLQMLAYTGNAIQLRTDYEVEGKTYSTIDPGVITPEASGIIQIEERPMSMTQAPNQRVMTQDEATFVFETDYWKGLDDKGYSYDVQYKDPYDDDWQTLATSVTFGGTYTLNTVDNSQVNKVDIEAHTVDTLAKGKETASMIHDNKWLPADFWRPDGFTDQQCAQKHTTITLTLHAADYNWSGYYFRIVASYRFNEKRTKVENSYSAIGDADNAGFDTSRYGLLQVDAPFVSATMLEARALMMQEHNSEGDATGDFGQNYWSVETTQDQVDNWNASRGGSNNPLISDKNVAVYTTTITFSPGKLTESGNRILTPVLQWGFQDDLNSESTDYKPVIAPININGYANGGNGLTTENYKDWANIVKTRYDINTDDSSVMKQVVDAIETEHSGSPFGKFTAYITIDDIKPVEDTMLNGQPFDINSAYAKWSITTSLHIESATNPMDFGTEHFYFQCKPYLEYIRGYNSTKLKSQTITNTLAHNFDYVNGGIDEDNTDTGAELWLDYIDGKLTVKPLIINIKAEDDRKTYGDNDPDKFNVSYTLTNEKDEPYTPDKDLRDYIDRALNLDAARVPGENVRTENPGYSIVPTYTEVDNIEIGTVTPGHFFIDPREVTITANSAEKVYDGTPLTEPGYTYAPELVDNDLLGIHDKMDSVTVTGSQTEVGSSKNVPSDAVIINTEDGSGSNANYIIKYVDGTLTVRDKEIVSIEKSADRERATDYDVIRYTITVTNATSHDLHNVIVKDTNNFVGVPVLSQANGVTYDAEKGEFVIAEISHLRDETHTNAVTFTYTYAVDPTDHGTNNNDILENNAKITDMKVVESYTENPDGSTTPNYTEPNKDWLVETPDVDVEIIRQNLTIEKSADKTEAGVGDVVTYTLKVTNTGNTKLENVVVKDTNNFMGEPVENTKLHFGYRVNDDGTWTITSLGIGKSVTITYKYTVVADDLSNGKLDNIATATIPAREDPTIPEKPVDSNEVIVPLYYKHLTIVKSADRDHAYPGEVVKYQVTVTNDGTVDMTNVTVSDNTNALGMFIVSTGDGYTYNPETRLFTIPALNVGDSVTLNYLYIVQNGDPETIINVATAHAPKNPDTEIPGDKDIEEPSKPVEVDVLRDELTIVKNADKSFVDMNGNDTTVTYTLTVKNSGNTKLTNVIVTDTSNGNGTVEYTGDLMYDGNGKWMIPELNAGESVEITYIYTAVAEDMNLDNGNIVNTAVAEGKNPDNKTVTSDPDTETVHVGEVPDRDIRVVKTSLESSVMIGDTIHYTITVTNNGTMAAQNVVVRDFNDGVGEINAASSDKYTYDAATHSFTIAEIAAGETVEIPVTYTVQEGDKGTVNNAAVEIPEVPEIEKKADKQTVVVGEVVTYTITVTNTTNETKTNVEVKDTNNFTGVITPAENTDVVSYIGDKVWNISSIGAGESVDIVYTYTVMNEDAPNTMLVNNAEMTYVTDSGKVKIPSNEVDIPVIPETPTPEHVGPTVVKQADKAIANIGDTVHYTVVMHNNDTVDYVNAALHDKNNFNGVITNVKNGTLESASAGSAVIKVGTIPAGKTVTVEYDYIVLNTDAGKGQDTYNELKNVATLHYWFADEDQTPENEKTKPSNEVTVKVPGSDVPVPVNPPEGKLKVEKFVDKKSASVGDMLHYTVKVSNVGDGELKNILVEDFFDGHGKLNYIPAVGVVVNGDGTYTINKLPAGTFMELRFTYVIVEGDEPEVLNAAVVTTPPVDPPLEPTKTADKKFAFVDEIVTYTISVYNPDTKAKTNVTVKDTNNFVGSINATNTDKYTYNGDNTWTIPEIGAGETIDITYTYTVQSNDEKLLENKADVTYSENGDTVKLDTPTVDVVVPDKGTVSIHKEADKKMAKPGEVVTYNVTVTNNKGFDVHDVVVTDANNFAGEITGVDGADYTFENGEFHIAEIAAGASVTLTYTYTVEIGDVPTQILENIATADVPGTNPEDPNNPGHGKDPNKPIDNDEKIPSNPVDVEVPGSETETKIPDLVLTKSVDKSEAAVGDTLNYTITVKNNGKGDAENVTVKDFFDGKGTLNFVAMDGVTDNGDNTYTIASVKAGESVTLDFTYVVVDGDAPEVLNAAVITTPEPPTDIVKSADKHIAKVNEIVTYTITVKNNSMDTLTNLLVSDTNNFKGEIEAKDGKGYTYNGDKTWTIATLESGKSIDITYTYTMQASDETVIENTADVRYSHNGTDYDIPSNPVDIEKPNDGVVTIFKTADKTKAEPNEVVTYTVTIHNGKDYDIKNVRLTDANNFAGKIEGVDGAGYKFINGEFVIDKIPAGGDAVVRYTYTVQIADVPTKILENVATAHVPGKNPGDPDEEIPSNKVDVEVPGDGTHVDVPEGKLEIVKSVDKAEAKVGDTLNYTITLTNVGGQAVKNAVVKDFFDGNGVLNFVPMDGVTDNGDYTYTVANVEKGQSITLRFTYTVVAGDAPMVLNAAVVKDPTPPVDIEKTADKHVAMVDEVVNYTITVKNTTDKAVTDLLVSDTNNFTGAIASKDNAKYTYNGNHTWTIPSIKAGESIDILYTYTVKTTDPSTLVNEADVRYTTDDGEYVIKADPVEVVVPKDGEVTIVKSGDKKIAEPGEVVTYTVTIHNGKAHDITNVVVSDSNNFAGTITGTNGVGYKFVDGHFVIDKIAAGADAVLTYTYTVQIADVPTHILENVATAHVPGTNPEDPENPGHGKDPDKPIDPDTDIPSNKVEVEVTGSEVETEIPEISITKSVDKPTAKIGDTLNYTVTVKNGGNADAENILIKDFFDGNGTLNFKAMDGVTDNGDNTYTISTVKAGESVKLRFSYVVVEGDEPLVLNAAVIKDPTPPVDVEKESDKHIAKVDEVVTYTISVKNTTSEPVDNVTVTDTNNFKGEIKAENADKYTYNGNKTWTIPTIAAGETIYITYTYTMQAEDATVIENIANVTYSKDGIDYNIPSNPVDVEKPDDGVVTIRKAADKTKAEPGEVVTYTVTVHNGKNHDIENARLTDTNNFAGEIVSVDGADYTFENGEFTINKIPAGGDVIIHYTYTVEIADVPTQILENIATIHVPGTNPEDPNNPGHGKDPEKPIDPDTEIPSNKVDVEVPGSETETEIPVIEITKSVDKAEAKVGDTLNYTVTVANKGKVDAENVVVEDFFDGNGTLNFVPMDGVADNGDNSYTISTVKAGESVTLNFTYVVVTADAPKVLNAAVVKDPTPPIDVEKDADKYIAKVTDVVTYTITVKNTTDETVNDITVADHNNFAGDVTAESSNRYTYNGDGTWTIGYLNAGEALDIVYTYTVETTDESVMENTATIKYTHDGEQYNIPSNTVDVKKPDDGVVTIWKSANKTVAKPGETVTYTVTVHNGKDHDIQNAALTDENNFSGSIFAVDGAGYHYENGVFTIDTIPAGGDVVVHYAYTVGIADVTTHILENVATIHVPGTNPEDPENPGQGKDPTKPIDPDTDIPSNKVDVEVPGSGTETDIPLEKSLTIVKSADKTKVNVGETINYRVVVTNTGEVDLVNVTVKDNNDGASHIEAKNGDGYTYDSATTTFTIARIPVGESFTLTYSYVAVDADAGHDVINVAVAKAPGQNPEDPENPGHGKDPSKPIDEDVEKPSNEVKVPVVKPSTPTTPDEPKPTPTPDNPKPTPTPVPTEKPKTPPIGWLDIFKVDGKPFSLFSIFTSNKKTGIGFAQSIVGLAAMVGIGVAALVVVNHKRKKDENDNKDNHKDDSAE